MLLKTFYIPIGILILVICAIGFLSLRSDVPDAPIKIYKVVEPDAKSTEEVPVGDTSQGGHWHGDEWKPAEPHANQPHREETPQEKFDREMLEKMARLRQEIAKYKAETKAAEAKTKVYRDEIEALKAKNKEHNQHLNLIAETGRKIASQFEDVLTMTPEKYSVLSETAQEDFLLRCVEYDLAVNELKDMISSTPQWVLDAFEARHPGTIDWFLNYPLFSDLYGRL